jgi:predicted small secreted protein
MKTSLKPALLLAIAGALLVVAGCNTANGFGKDVEKAGEKIQQKAK